MFSYINLSVRQFLFHIFPMKTFSVAALCLALSVAGTYAQTANNTVTTVPPATTPQVVESGAN